MSTPMEHIAYLSQEIGPRPSGTEEEQQAALYITDRLQKDAHLPANIEDFSCSNNVRLPQLVCSVIPILAIVLSIVFPVASIPAAIVAFMAAALLLLETFDKPVLSRFFMKGYSQNVVGKYEPVRDPDGPGARRRKVILVAHYDTGKVRHDYAHLLIPARRIIDIAVLAVSVLIPVFILICRLAFGDVSGSGAIAIIVVKVLLAVVMLIPVAVFVMEKVSGLNEGAISNASGVAVMLEVARRLGNGEVSASPIPAGVVHGEQAARDADVVPEGASIHYSVDSDDDFAGAKAAAIAMAGGAARGKVRDIADNLVQVKEAPLQMPDEAALSKARQDTRAALASAPAGTLAEAAAKAAALHEQAEQRAAEEAAALERAAKEAEEAAALAEEQRKEEELRQAEAEAPAGVPDWYKKATERARNKAERSAEKEDASAYRSRYADFPSENAPAESDQAQPDAAPAHEAEAEQPGEVLVQEDSTSAPVAAGADDSLEAKESESAVAAAPVEESVNPGATTAMPPLADAGNLDLAALRAAAQGGKAPRDDAQATGVVDISGAATTRLPQMMYYTPPEDRSSVIRDRAQKDRVVVSADGVDQAVTVDAAQAPAVDRSQAPVAGGRVITPNIPVVDLPQITLPPISAPELKPVSFEEFRQRAPLANVAESHGKEAAKSLLATTLPSIEEPDGGATVGMPAIQQEKSQNVSLTGSFAAVEAIGSKPVGDELLEGMDPEDIYVDDADDSVFDSEFTETGAFAGPGYVDMPQSRVGKFFDRFRRKKNKEEESAHDWLGIDESFDARSVGKARGGWESFRDEEDDWQGGAFDSLRARMSRGGEGESDGAAAGDGEEAYAETRGHMSDVASVSANEFAAVAALAASKAATSDSVDPVPHADFNDMQQIYSFAAGDINTEVWFVALGSELAGQGGIKAFLADHASDMRGAIIVNLESLGAGDLCYLDREGAITQMGCSPRMKRFLRKASQASGIDIQAASVNWRESPASYAMKHRAQAVSIVGMDGNKPAFLGEADDVIENVDEDSLNRAADFVVELLKNI